MKSLNINVENGNLTSRHVHTVVALREIYE